MPSIRDKLISDIIKTANQNDFYNSMLARSNNFYVNNMPKVKATPKPGNLLAKAALPALATAGAGIFLYDKLQDVSETLSGVK